MGNTPLDETKIEQIKKSSGYSTTETFISNADSIYRVWLRQSTEQPPMDWETHCNRLMKILDELLPALKTARDMETEKDDKLATAGLTVEQLNGKEYIDDKGDRLLLEHIKSEIPELRKFDSWYDMTARDLTDELLDKLTVIDMRGTLRGKCEGCPETRKTITLVLAIESS